ncbi:MAG: restriction endonuclease subunit S [Candidatus Moranbacteria bacterium]|jgi:type I restriction enzyme S subunit|nr:restriction endonuclease subunit S [Candidatus Moranbacteria bacterium]
MNNWKETTLDNAVEIIKDSWKPGDGFSKYLGLEHINENSLTLNGIGNSGELKSNKFKFENGDILFGKLRPYFRKVVMPKFSGVCSTDIWVMRAKDSFDQKYLFYFVANPIFIDKSMGANTGTHMPRADWNYLKNTKWKFPEYGEQKQIAAILSSLDDKIELLRAENETLEKIAQGIFKEWFVNFTIDGKKLKLKDGIPEGWRVGRLTEIADFLNGYAMQKFPAKNQLEYFPVIKIKEMSSGITSQTDKASKDIPEKYIVENGDILFSWSGSLDIDIWKYGKGVLNQHLFKVTSEKFPKWFYFYWVKFHLPSFKQIASAKAVTMGHIQRHHLEDANVIIPDEKSLEAVDDLIKPVFEKVILNNSQIQTLSRLRDNLLPKLMSGEIKV